MTTLQFLHYPPAEDAPDDAPLILFLHGSGERGDDLTLVHKYGLTRELEGGLRLPAHVVAPQCPAEHWWMSELDALDKLLDGLVTEHKPRHVSLTGFSMGGFGVWAWALKRPDRFACIAPVGGSALERGGFRLVDPAALCALPMPIWMIHGAADPIVTVEGADDVAKLLEACHPRFRYTRYDDADHGETSDRAYADAELHAWLTAGGAQ